MKKLVLVAVLGAFVVACSSNAREDDTAAQYSKYQIIDQEFENMEVPNRDYDKVPAYEEQVAGASYIQSSTSTTRSASKPRRTTTVQKVVVDGQGNKLSTDTAATVTDQEALPDTASAGDNF